MTLASRVRKNALLILTLMAVAIGIVLGFYARRFSIDKKSALFRVINFPGEIFFRSVKLLIIPILSSSIITGIAGNTAIKSGSLARRTILLFSITTLQAATLGTLFVITIQPGNLNKSYLNNSESNSQSFSSSSVPKLGSLDTFMDVIRNLIPENLIEMCFQVYKSKLQAVEQNSETTYIIVPSYTRGVNILGLAFYSCAFGTVLSSLGERGHTMLKFFEGFNEISVKMMRIIMWCSPVGVCSIVCVSIILMEDPMTIFTRVIYYLLTLFSALFVHGAIVLPLMFFLITRQNPFAYMKHLIQVVLIAFATSSSSATLPTSIECVEKKARVSSYVSRIVLPCGMVANMDGSVIAYLVSTIFLAQISDIYLGPIDLIVFTLIASLLSTAGSGAPGGHLAKIILLLSMMNVPAIQLSLLLGVDWIVDRFLTIVNCWGDCMVCGMVAHLTQDDLKKNLGVDEKQFDSFLEESANLEPITTRL